MKTLVGKEAHDLGGQFPVPATEYVRQEAKIWGKVAARSHLSGNGVKTSNVKQDDQLLANMTAKWIKYETLKRIQRPGKSKRRRRFPNQDLLRVMIICFFSPSFLLAMAMWADVFLSSPDHL